MWSECFIFCFCVMFDMAQMDLPSSTPNINGWFRFSCELLNAQINTDICLKGICIFTGNDVINYFQSAANRVHASATMADFAITKQSFWKILEIAEASNFAQRFALSHQLVGFLVEKTCKSCMLTTNCCLPSFWLEHVGTSVSHVMCNIVFTTICVSDCQLVLGMIINYPQTKCWRYGP